MISILTFPRFLSRRALIESSYKTPRTNADLKLSGTIRLETEREDERKEVKGKKKKSFKGHRHVNTD